MTWIVLIVMVAGLGFFVSCSKTPAPAKLAEATPAPAPPVSTPARIVQTTPTPTPAQVALATPTPEPAATPRSLDLATVVRNRALWPAQVALVQPKAFPMSLNGRVVGEVKAPAGTVLRVLQVGTLQVEVEYQGQRQLVPVAMTDLMLRATALFRKTGASIPDSTPLVMPPLYAASAGATTATAPMPTAGSAGAPIGDRLLADVTRQRKSRIEGGDWDDKKDRIVLHVKITNSDTKLSADNFKGEIYTLAESILEPSTLKLLAKQDFSFSLPPRASHEFATAEAVTAYDTTGARFGYKYSGWLLRIRDCNGKIVSEKSTSPSLLKQAEKVASFKAGSLFDRSSLAPRKEL